MAKTNELDWSSLILFPEPYEWVPSVRDRPQAKKRRELLLNQRPERYESLSRFFADNGCMLSAKDADLNSVSMFFGEHIPGRFETELEDRRWRELVTDLGLFLGDLIIAQDPSGRLHWADRNHALEGGQSRFALVIKGRGGPSDYVDPSYHFGMVSISKAEGSEHTKNVVPQIRRYANLTFGT